MTSREMTNTVESKKPPRRIPAKTPKRMPKTDSKMIAMTVSFTVTGKALAITWVTGTPEKVVPKSNMKMPLI